MKKITKRVIIICAIFGFTFSAIAQNTSAQFPNNVNGSLEIQAQIQEALSRQTITNSQSSNRAPLAATYVGSFKTSDGPSWGGNPAAISAVEAAALIFGGSPSDYAISTNPNTTDPLTITHTAWATIYAVADCQEVAEDYFLDLGAPGYSDPAVAGSGVSAYVNDNCTFGNTNYVWLVDPAPSITCPGDITVSNDPGICGAIVNYTVTATSGSSTIPPLNGFSDFTKLGTYNGHTYYMSNNPMNATAAFADALSKGGYVATINDAAENTYINDVVFASNPAYNVYIGLNDVSIEGSYEWQNGAPATYTNWAPGEPNDSGGEDYVIMYSGGLWNDVQEVHNDRYILEIDATFEQTAGLPSGSTFPVGTTTNTFEVTDSNGTSSCSFDVTVNDTEAPVFADIYGYGTLANPFTSLLPEIVGSVASGTYYFSFNGNTFQGVLDNDTDGGGWLMILNYVHQAGDNSDLQVRNTDLPLLGASILGSSEAASSTWGHFGNALAADLDFEEVRFFAQTSRDINNIIDFTTDFSSVLDYVKTGNGSFSGINNPTNYTLGANHNASIPQNAPDFFSNEGDFALTNFPFWRGGQAHWGIRGLGNRWEVDDFTNNSFSTIHRVWVRGDLSPSSNIENTTITAQLDASGSVTIAAADFGLMPIDNCSAVTQTLSMDTFDCSNIGSNTIQLTATDAVGNETTIDVFVNVEDTLAPVVVCQNITVQLDANGDATITPANVDGGSIDNCGIASLQFADSITAFAEVGENQTLNITLPAGRVITSVDFASYGTPNGSNGNYTIGSCHEPTSIAILESYALGNNSFSIPATNAVFGDPCGGTQKRLYVTVSSTLDSASLSFNCSNVGDNDVTLLVTDVNGNTATCTATVTVEDNIAPVANCAAPFTIQLDANGDASITVANIENGSTDACGIASTSIDVTSFNCSNVGPNTVTLTVTDVNGNGSTCTTVVTVEDNVAPVANCAAPFTIQLDANGEASITVADIENGSTDACGIASTSID
ncbi:lectin-like protein, partial [Aequorivita antarctica]